MDVTDSPVAQQEMPPVFGARFAWLIGWIEMYVLFCRLRPDKSQIDTLFGQTKIHRSPSLSSLAPSASLTKPLKYSYRNYGSGTFDQTTKHTMWPRVYLVFVNVHTYRYFVFASSCL